jgi:hypothetical protein
MFALIPFIDIGKEVFEDAAGEEAALAGRS